MNFAAEYIQELNKITAKYEQKRAALLPVLHYVQHKEGLISPEAQENIAQYLEIPVVHVYEAVTFYHLFRQTKKGKCHFSVCQTTSCALRASEAIVEHLQERLGIKSGETTPDGKFSLSLVECLGACETAPVMQVNGEYCGCLNKKKIDEIIGKNSS